MKLNLSKEKRKKNEESQLQDKVQYNSKFFFINHPKKTALMSEYNDQQHLVTASKGSEDQKQSHKQDFKLPKLSMPHSRGRLMSRKQNKAPIHLPSIHDDAQSDVNFRNTEMIHISKSQNDIAKSDGHSIRDEFAYEIQEKLKMLIGKQQSQVSGQHDSQLHQNESNDHISDDLDFQQKILQNKEIIKMHRKKTQLPQKKMYKPLEILEKLNQNNKIKSSKPLTNYQRKMKDYNMSLENKYLQRKKQSLGIIPEKQKPVQRAKSKKILSLKDTAIQEAKLNFGYKQFKNNQIAKSQSKDHPRPLNSININKNHKQSSSAHTQKFEKPPVKQANKVQEPPSPSKRINRTSALFDNIQSFLQNPTIAQKHQKLYKQLYKRLKTKNIPQLQEQLKELNEKMGTNQNYETKSTVGKEQESSRHILLTQAPMQRTARDWKRIDIKDKNNIHYKQSDFEKQLDYVSYLQQKNSTSLSNFIDQQKIMVQLQMNRRLSKSIAKEHSHDVKQNKQNPLEIRKTAEQSTQN